MAARNGERMAEQLAQRQNDHRAAGQTHGAKGQHRHVLKRDFDDWPIDAPKNRQKDQQNKAVARQAGWLRAWRGGVQTSISIANFTALSGRLNKPNWEGSKLCKFNPSLRKISERNSIRC